MKSLFSLAWKNLTRYRKRTLITATALAFGLAIFILIDSMLIGLDKDSEINLIRYETASMRVMADDYWEKQASRPINRLVEDPEEAFAFLEAEGLSGVPRISFRGDMILYKDPFPEDGSLPVQIEAIDPLRDDEVFSFRDTVVEGRYLEPGANEVLIGGWLAEDIGAEVGFPVKILTRTRDGYQQSFTLEIVGIVNCPNPNINRSNLFMPIDVADDYLEMDGAVTGISMALGDYSSADVRAEALNSDEGLPGGLVVQPWQVMARDYLQMAAAKRGGSGTVLFLVILIAAVGITNTLLMSIFERTRELGMMRALGMSNRDIRLMFLYESAGIGLLGGLIGVALGAAMVFPLVRWGLDFTWVFRDMDVGYRISGIMYGVWNPTAIVGALVIGVVICVVIAWFPAKKAINMKITDCLNYQ